MLLRQHEMSMRSGALDGVVCGWEFTRRRQMDRICHNGAGIIEIILYYSLYLPNDRNTHTHTIRQHMIHYVYIWWLWILSHQLVNVFLFLCIYYALQVIALCQKQYYIYFIAWHNNRGSSNHRDSNKFEIDTINSRWCFRKKCAPHTHAHTLLFFFRLVQLFGVSNAILKHNLCHFNPRFRNLSHVMAQNVAKGRGKDAIFGPEPMAIIQHSFILFSRTTHVHRYMTMENE